MGFSGLESMVTEESELAPWAVGVPKSPTPSNKVAAFSSTATIARPGGAPDEAPPMSNDPRLPEQPSGKSSPGWIWAIVLVVVVLFGVALNSSRKEIITSPAPTPQPAVVAAPHMVVVAALTANIREKPTAQSHLLRSLKRGERIEFVGIAGTFTQIRLADSTLAFVASELVIPEGDYNRLNGMSPQQYLDVRAPERRIESIFEQIKPLKDNVLEVLFQITNRDPLVRDKLQMIEAMRAVQIDADESAGIWFSLAARAAANSGQFDEAGLNARAAVEADPTNPDYHVAFALAKYSQGQVEPVRFAAHALAVLAPRATNTWMLFGLAEAMDDGDSKLDGLATGSFILAIKLSRNPEATRKYFKDLIAKSENPRVQQLIRDAMVEETSTPSVFGY